MRIGCFLLLIFFLSACSKPENSLIDDLGKKQASYLEMVSRSIKSKEITIVDELKGLGNPISVKTREIYIQSRGGDIPVECREWQEEFDINYYPNLLGVCYEEPGNIVYSYYQTGSLTQNGCGLLGGEVILDIGDGSTRCPRGSETLGSISLGIEGARCCKKR
ncbi:MAG: hypothetical protein AABW64_04795 [Nanoarchaeota archaeon]